MSESGRGPVTPPRPTLRGRALMGAAALLGALPERPLIAAAEAIGLLWYRVAPAKRDQARANLRRVCEGLDAQGRGTPLARRAATDPDALEQLVRRCFGHAARYYLEVARTGGLDVPTATARIDVETPDTVAEALAIDGPMMLVGMHYGAIELPTLFFSHLVGHRFTAPMETVSDAGLQAWFVASRSRVGVNIVPISDARRALTAAIRRGESVGLVADRDLTSGGVPTDFFGHPAPIPVGPALLAIESGVPVYAASARRTRGGRYAGKLVRVEIPEHGTRRDRMTAMTASMVATFETILADGPEQWWGAFHPIWPDLVVGADAGSGANPAVGTGPGARA